MFQPIQKDHESCCPNCGCVLAEITEAPEIEYTPAQSKRTVDLMLLGSAAQNIKLSIRKTSQQVFEEKTLRLLTNITKQYGLPENLAIDTFHQLKRNKRGFRSETEPIKQLIKILSKDDNYLFIKQKNLIKARYENITHP